jgi:hypothetical protein
MSIKNLKPKSNSPYKQGYYSPVNLEKYMADPGQIIYRSSWEYRFCHACDMNPNIVKWSSEPIGIDFYNPIKVANWQQKGVEPKLSKYYIDFFIVVKQGNELKKYLVEVKPNSHIKPPVLEGRQTLNKIKNYNYLLNAYIVNRAKFEAAQRYAQLNGWQFVVCDEKFFSNI